MSCACPTSSCTFAVRASFRWSVGARRIHSRSGRTPISSELPCIWMNFTSRARYSSGIQSPASAWPPACRCSMNSVSVMANLPIGRLPQRMSARREELTRTAARLFAERGYHGTSLADLAEALGIQKASLYHHIASKEDLLWEVAESGATAFHGALDAVPDEAPATEKIRLALRGHLAVVAAQLDAATVFTREWRALEGERRAVFLAERRRYEERIRDLFREGVETGQLR